MSPETARDSERVWSLADRQHGVVTRRQLLDAGFSPDEIDGRVARGRLHRLWRGIYAVGRPRLTRPGWWSAAVLACGDGTVLSYDSAAALWRIREATPGHDGERDRPRTIHVSVSATRSPRRTGIRVHRRRLLSDSEWTRRSGIPVTTPARTLIDLAALHCSNHLEACVNEADKLGLIDPEALRSEVERRGGTDGRRCCGA